MKTSTKLRIQALEYAFANGRSATKTQMIEDAELIYQFIIKDQKDAELPADMPVVECENEAAIQTPQSNGWIRMKISICRVDS